MCYRTGQFYLLPTITRSGLCATGAIRHHIRLIPQRRMHMRWEIPRATDLRFGMEITLYIARR